MTNNGLSRRPVAWSPATVRLPSPRLGTNFLGQQGGGDFLSSPTVTMLLDLYTAGAALGLGYIYTAKRSNAGSFWYAVGAAATMKALYDMSKL